MNELLKFLEIGEILTEVAVALGPLLLFFGLFQVFFLRLPAAYIVNLVKGVCMAFVGLVLFLQGVKVGFLPAGTEMGVLLGASENKWILVPIGFAFGFVATIAEPAVRILGFEVEKATSGFIRARVILITLASGVAVFVAMGMFRTVYGVPIHYFVIPGYLIILGMLRFTNPTFVSIAFDAGGVATGPMTVTFVMALSVGVATILGNRSPILDGFGLIALVAMAPILSLMSLGLLYSWRKRKRA
ncbi:MAG: DUF1538 domain-containing protein [Deltaproteobacteria bacterium]|jgi:hypothetical protein|nr:DUF1538 domain-containing protein [Deltaproteobacteria bacterium]